MNTRSDKAPADKSKSVAMALGAFVLGIASTIATSYFSETYKAYLDRKKVMLASRTALWTSTTTNFARYITNWDRLRLLKLGELDSAVVGIGACEQKLRSRPVINGPAGIAMSAREKQYSDERDKAKDSLAADLEQARYLFGATVKTGIGRFDAFRVQYRTTSACALPGPEALRDIQSTILSSMLDELSTIEKGEK